MERTAVRIFLAGLALLHSLCCVLLGQDANTKTSDGFPRELVQFGKPSEKPLFAGRSESDWDHKIRERGWIHKDETGWHLWYTGYNDLVAKERKLGYATSPDGIRWTRVSDNPLNTMGWVEDMCVVVKDKTYYMFAEGRKDIAHMLVSTDRIHWDEKGPLDIRKKDGQPIEPGPRGTPTVWFESNVWWLFYERMDLAIYVATSTDLKVWTNVQDEPCIPCGPDAYDRYAVAMNQIIKVGGEYYGYYHASALEKRGEWSTCIAKSEDLIHWTKFAGNPILPVDPKMRGASSGTVIFDGTRYRLYTTHPDVRLYGSIESAGVR
jgi:beta-1,2-mannobiose phosphorylase / 1,2-beta-oligomannan phosphorylase